MLGGGNLEGCVFGHVDLVLRLGQEDAAGRKGDWNLQVCRVWEAASHKIMSPRRCGTLDMWGSRICFVLDEMQARR